MVKDDAIRNQKVFVKLESILKVQSEYKRLGDSHAALKREVDSNNYLKDADQKRLRESALYFNGFQKVIQMLELPMEF